MTPGCKHRVRVDPEAVERSIDYLLRACRHDGRFEYRINIDPAVTIRPRYNVLRHAGAMYALATHCAAQPDLRTIEKLGRAARFLQEHCIGPIEGEPGLVGLWSRPEINGSGRNTQVKLGGAGLGLVALTALETLATGSTPPEDLRGLGRFIVWMQKDDGSFYSKYIPSSVGRRDRWTSLYYPGEAALGLLMLDALDPAPEWKRGAARALGFLARDRAGAETVPADHWALIATSRILPVYDECDALEPREAIVAHAVQVCESILAEQVWDCDDPRLDGGFSRDGRTTPTATRLEGLLAALEFLPESDLDLRMRVASSVEHGMKFLLRAQVREGAFAGGVPRAICRLAEDDPRNVRSFNDRATEIRIDYVQHAVCAMMQYRAWCGRPF